MKSVLVSIAPEVLASASGAICERIAASSEFAAASTILLFTPLPGEVNLAALATRARVMGKRLALTRMDWATRELKPVAIDRWGAGLVPGRFGVLEPGEEAAPIPITEIGLILVPGLAFDSCRKRLGRGAGFYDRFLGSPGVSAAKIGVALEEQMVEKVPVESHDVILDAIATPDRWITAQ